MQQQIIDKGLRFFVIDASKAAQEAGLRGRTNTVLQTCFFAISGVLPREEAIGQIKEAIRKTYAREGRGGACGGISRRSTARWRGCSRWRCRAEATSRWDRPPLVPADAPEFVREVTAKMLEGRGDEIPGEPDAGRRHLPVRHGRLGEAQHRRRRAGVGAGPLHPVRPVQLRLPARGDPRQVLRSRQAGRSAPRASSRRRSTCAASPTCASRCSSTSRTAPAAGCASRPAPRIAPSSPSVKAINMRDKPPPRRGRAARTWRSSRRCR